MAQFGRWNFGNADPRQNKYNYQFNLAPGYKWDQGNLGSTMYTLGYDKSSDRNIHQTAGGAGQEDNWNRVWRWMNEAARANGWNDVKDTDEETQRKFIDYAVGRLRTDYANTGLDWNQSGFAKYGQWENNRAPSAAPAPTPAPGTDPRVNPPPAPTPTTGTAGPAPTPGGTPAPGTTPVTAAPPPGGTNPGSGTTQMERDTWLEDPAAALREAMRRKGIDINQPGIVAELIRSRYQPMIEARIAAEAAQSGDESYATNIDNILAEYGGVVDKGNQNFYTNQRQIAEKALGANDYINELETRQQQSYIEQMNALRQAGFNPMVRSANVNRYGREINSYLDESVRNPQSATGFNQWLRNRPSWQFFSSGGR